MVVGVVHGGCWRVHAFWSLPFPEVVITMGSEGAILCQENQATHVPPIPVNVIDTTAAGDAFAGALAVRWAQTGDLLTAVGFANVAGAIAASRAGAQASLGTKEEIEATA